MSEKGIEDGDKKREFENMVKKQHYTLDGQYSPVYLVGYNH